MALRRACLVFKSGHARGFFPPGVSSWAFARRMRSTLTLAVLLWTRQLRSSNTISTWVLGGAPRRAALAGAWLVSVIPAAPRSADAFENSLPEVTQFAQNRNSGVQPTDLGLQVRKIGKFAVVSDGPVLKECGNGPNCFTTTGDEDDPSKEATWLKQWKVPSGKQPSEAVVQLKDLISSYPPGQNGVDGGGFKIVQTTDSYIYAQFESLKKGKVDDVEFSIGKDGAVQVRASGRFAMKADFGSNAKRLNYFATRLEEKGWTAPQITKDTHAYYFKMNAGKTKVQCNGLNCPWNYELISEEPGPSADD